MTERRSSIVLILLVQPVIELIEFCSFYLGIGLVNNFFIKFFFQTTSLLSIVELISSNSTFQAVIFKSWNCMNYFLTSFYIVRI